MSSVNSVLVVSHKTVHGIPFEKCLPGQRILKVLIVRGVSLMKKDIFGTSDPYCRLSLYRDVRQAIALGSSVRTCTIRRNLNPEWNEEFYFRVNPESNRLLLEIFDENRITRDDFLGLVSISLPQTDIPVEEREDLSRTNAKPYILKPRRALSRVEGKLVIGLSYLPPSTDIRLTHIPDSVAKLPPSSSRLSLPSTVLLPLGGVMNPSTSSFSSPGSVKCSNEVSTTTTPQSPPPPPGVNPLMLMSTSTIMDENNMEVAESNLPEGWDERVDQNGRTYYVDHIHKRTQWDRPMSRLPEGWEQRTDVNGRVYYVDHINHRTTWYSPLFSENEGWMNVSSQGVGASASRNGDENAPPSEDPIPEASTPADASFDDSDVIEDPQQIRHTLRHGGQTLLSLHHNQGRQHFYNYSTLSPEQQVQAAQTMYLRRHQVRVEDTTPQTESLAVVAEASDAPAPVLSLTGERDMDPEIPKPSALPTECDQPEVIPETPIVPVLMAPAAGGEAITPAASSTTITVESPPPPPAAAAAAATAVISNGASATENRISIVSLDDDPLPPGWQMAVTASGRRFFINHNDQTTTWKDPRKRGGDTLSTKLESSVTTSVMAKAAQRHNMPVLGPLPPGWEERVHSNGRIFYINHNARTTQWEDPRLERLGGPAVPYSRNYRQKYEYFRSRLRAPRDLSAKFEIRVTRSGIFEDSFRLIYSVKKPEMLMHRLWIEFLGEKGLDYGGVQREWFFLLSREMFNPYYGLFEYSAADNYTLQINPLSGLANENHLRYFKFIGRVCGMAVYHGKLVDGFFIRPFYKMMLGRKIGLKDMEAVDSGYYRSLKYILDADPRDLELTFAVDEEHFGETVEVELIPNGRSCLVTNANKRDYIERIINWRFVSRVEHQMCAFLEGFNDIIPLETLQLFDANELELLMCGLQDINVHDWKANTLYKGEYHANHPVIVNFWKTLYTFTNELRSRLLQFVTGTSRVPMNGFVELWGSAGPQKFTIESWGSPNQLPRAHTCFNRLDLPPYGSFDELRCKLIIAIENAEGFEGVD
ncbi:neural cell expressed developmentally [Echinococcus multilocularis]|uniref:HECT-type E3 ubiquitin transferase n=1 Tax=Echinococcus multilocularis TaxID=6211 RepID=A0A068XVY3_ECHMU|nr:neural cell expressed developmentally [Echinococcus multilocularis]